jgi:hypothetical protein
MTKERSSGSVVVVVVVGKGGKQEMTESMVKTTGYSPVPSLSVSFFAY